MNRLKPRRLRPYSRKVFVEEFDRKGELTYAAERMRELDEQKGTMIPSPLPSTFWKSGWPTSAGSTPPTRP